MGKALIHLGGVQFFDDDGDPLNGGKVYVYATGTSTPVSAYRDADLTTPHASPITLDAAGRPPSNAIWVNEEVDFDVRTSAGVSLYTVDNVNPSASGFGTMAVKNSNVLIKSTTYAVVAGDDGKFLVASGTSSWTMALLAAATAGDGFFFSVFNNGTGIVTIDPDSSETVNGSSTLTIGPQEGAEVRCDGTGWYARVNGAVQKLQAGTSVTGSSVEFKNLVSAFRKFELVFDSFRPATDNVTLRARVSDDNGSSYKSGASDYAWSLTATPGTAGPTVSGDGDDADAEIEIAQGCGNNAAEHMAGVIEVFPSFGGRPQMFFRWSRQTQAPTYYSCAGGGQYAVGTLTMNAFNLAFSSGNIGNLNYTLYGFRA